VPRHVVWIEEVAFVDGAGLAATISVNLGLICLELEEKEPMAAVRRKLEIQFKKGGGEEKAVPSFTYTTSSEECRWREERHDVIQQPLG